MSDTKRVADGAPSTLANSGGPGSVRAVLARHGRLDHESAKVHETAKHESREVGFAQH